ncbi:hypothetical protein GQ53DRAFT_450566 [Thozetella sp. PMI_491]|nr:hypothetical protein GQ53DRAFT_450566 [Thozetella sp. PMI_491]
MVQQKKLPNSGDIINGRREQTSMSFPRKDIADARPLPGNAGKADAKANGNRSSFRTDAAISNSRAGAERVLKPWVPDASDETDGSLEKPSGGGHWDQFAENERLFGLKSDYDESIYTTTIDRSHPQYKERMAAAERKAREIERSTTNNAHIAEERIMDFVGGKDNGDEEDKYSGVRRDTKQDFPPLANRENKYIPPSRRAPTGAATVKGAPVDPAIISSALKAAPAQKPAASKSEDSKSPVPAASKGPATPTPDAKPAEAKPAETKPEAKSPDAKAADAKASETKPVEAKAAETTATPLRPAATNSRTISPQTKDGPSAAPSATSTVERDVLNSFKNFATQQRMNAEKARSHKAKQDKEIKLIELKKFADSFKLSTPVPKDLISIIAKDPAKQKQIQEKARMNAEEIAKQKSDGTAKPKEPASTSTAETKPKPAAEAPSTPAAAAAAPADQRAASRPTPQHGSTPASVPNRHTGPRASYNPQQQQHYNGGYNRNNNRQPPHLGQTQQTGNLGSRLRANQHNQHNQKLDHQQHPHQQQPHPHVNQHLPPHPPTGPANSVESPYGRRLSGVPPTQPHAPAHLQAKLNPNSTEFRPSVFAPSFNPGSVHPSQSSSPRSSANNVSVPHPAPTPVPGQLIRRKTKAINTKKCFILGHIQSIPPPAGRSWDDNDGLRPAFDTHPTWRQLNDETDKPGSTMHMTYKEYFETLPITSVATPNPTHVVPIPHQHQLPFHMQHGGHGGPPRQSPHMPPMQMHTGQPGPVHVQFNPDDHRMVPSHSAQSYASPRMGQVPMAYPPTPSQMPYNQPVMPQQYMNPGTPQMNQFRSFSNNPQFVPQHPPNMGNPMMVQPHFMPGPNGMVAGPQVPMYGGGHPQFLPPGGGPPQAMPGTNGFPSPGRPVAPMMAHQGSHQGQPYGMSPAMGYQQPAYTPQQPGGKFQGQRPPQ